MSKEKLKTFECVEHGEKFLINAKDINEAYVIASKIKLLDISAFKNLFKIVEFQNYGK